MKTAINHSHADTKKKWYHSSKTHRYARVKYIWVFKHTTEMNFFSQVDNEAHAYLGRSRYGAVIDGIIKIEIDPGQELHEAKWTWVKEL
jgi:hypothetical protein